jgi:hypothetical protein|tara:strand:+ start:1152 stop:1337 length:186 start_codon:yes stop_codon:yes gene_type:complete
MKTSIKDLLKEFKDEDPTIQKLLKDVFIFENEILNSNNPQWRSEITNIIDSIIEKQTVKSK